MIALCCALCVTIVSSIAVLLFIAYGEHEQDWDNWGFCERPKGQDPWIAQPINTSSNIAFVMVGVWIAWSCDYQRPQKYWQNNNNNNNNNDDDNGGNLNLLTRSNSARSNYYGALWSSLVCLMGTGSTAFHASFTPFGTNVDQSMILLNATFLAVYSALRKRRNLRFSTYVMVFLIVAIPLVVLAFIPHSTGDPEGAAFVLLLVVTGCLEVWYKIASKIKNQQHQSTTTTTINSSCCGGGITNDDADIRFVGASLACLAVGLTIVYLSDTPGKPLCFPDSVFQGHGIWHVLSAIGLGFVFLYHLSVNEQTWRDNDDDDDDEYRNNRDENDEEDIIAMEVESKV